MLSANKMFQKEIKLVPPTFPLSLKIFEIELCVFLEPFPDEAIFLNVLIQTAQFVCMLGGGPGVEGANPGNTKT